jgi:hypothetical protein
LEEHCELAAAVNDGFLALAIRDLAVRIKAIDETAYNALMNYSNAELARFNKAFGTKLSVDKLSIEDLSAASKVPSVSSKRLAEAYHFFRENLDRELNAKILNKDNLTGRLFSSLFYAVEEDLRLRKNWLEDIKRNLLLKQELEVINPNTKITSESAGALLYSLRVGRIRQNAVDKIRISMLDEDYGLWNRRKLCAVLREIHDLRKEFDDTAYYKIISELERAGIHVEDGKLTITESMPALHHEIRKNVFMKGIDLEMALLLKASEIDTAILHLGQPRRAQGRLP